ncbi:hypothetical protein TPB0596_41120 [Tsukamurella pulmonis]|uniref:hypothetical protein n=1 Tax=Tsukamurella pulmonis TaxID=47312 RepID=UPI001EDC9544|nr:hypothetical protein [Tsukamurella pulmonis]BDD84349.1 hypothetical protein TPB0596_41120 [Tsukamurella pulmonis]
MARRWTLLRCAAAITTLFAVLGVGVVVPGSSGVASACSCASVEVPKDLTVVNGVVEKQLIGDRAVDLQVRVTSMHGAPPERVTVIRAESGRYSSCGDDYLDGQEVRLVVKPGGPRWVHPICSNAVLSRADAPDVTGVPPGPGAEEHRLPGPPLSWWNVAKQSYWSGPALVALALVLGLGLVVVLARRPRG